MKKRLSLVMALVFSVFMVGVAIADLATVTESMGQADEEMLNYSSPAATMTHLGTRIRGATFIGSTTQGAFTTYATGNTGVYVTPTTTVYLKTTDIVHGNSYLLGNGTAGQVWTPILVTDGGRDFTVTPQTKTGFTSATLNDAKDSVTFKYIDSTVGWVIIGNNGATIN